MNVLERNRDWLPGFTDDFRAKSMGFVKDLEKCLQCGKCVANCPAARISPYNSRQLIRDLLDGQIERVISSEELWLCFFCSSCYAACPKDINFPFAVAMLRYAALSQGYGWRYVQRISQPYARDYCTEGISVSRRESNPSIQQARARNSGTDGSIGAIRRQMGIPAQRTVSDKALTEIRFIADVTGMTASLKEMGNKRDKGPKFNYGNGTAAIKRNAEGKFIGLDGGGSDAAR